MSWNLHWSFVVAIAFNLLLISFNIFLVFKIQKWRKLLYQSRQKFSLYEQQLQSEADVILNNINLLPLAANDIVQRKRKINTLITQSKTLLFVLKILRKLASNR